MSVKAVSVYDNSFALCEPCRTQHLEIGGRHVELARNPLQLARIGCVFHELACSPRGCSITEPHCSPCAVCASHGASQVGVVI
jgi:hypothetical protein